MKLIIDIPKDIRVAIEQMGLLRIPNEMQKEVDRAIQRGIPHESVTEFADRCRECGREKVLDKIRAETEQTAKDYDKFDDYRRVRGLWIALEIIDKYTKGEQE